MDDQLRQPDTAPTRRSRRAANDRGALSLGHLGAVASACAAVLLLVGFFTLGRADMPPALTDSPNGYAVPLPGQTRQFSSPDLELRDDDRDRPLFDATSLAPGTVVRDCITLTYTGTAPRAQLSLIVRASGALAPGLATSIEQGTGGKFKDCAGFKPLHRVYAGTLEAMTAQHAPQHENGWPLTEVTRGTPATFRFTFQVADGIAQGATAGADFVWSAHV